VQAKRPTDRALRIDGQGHRAEHQAQHLDPDTTLDPWIHALADAQRL